MKTIVLTDTTFPAFVAEQAVATRIGAAFVRRECGARVLPEIAAGADVLLVQFAVVDAAAIAAMPRGAAIIRYGIGLDNIDLDAAAKHGVRVAYVPDYATGEVADHAAAMLLAALRKIMALDRSVRAGAWDPVGVARPMPAFQESTLGLIGFGRIGREVQARLAPFGFRAIVHDPMLDKITAQAMGVEWVGLDSLFTRADAISLHCPLSPATRHLVDAARLATMKSTAMIVNTSRGGLIHAGDLAQALGAGTIAGAALDVFEDEPLPADSPLRDAPNLILSPHAAWYSRESAGRVQTLAADEIERHLTGQPARCPAPGGA